MNAALRTTIASAPVDLPLSAPQYGMWAAQQLDPHSPAFWTAEAIELEGDLDRPALERAILETLAACDALHMRYSLLDGDVVQRLEPSRDDRLAYVDLSSAADPRVAAWSRMRADLATPVDLKTGPLFATELVRIESNEAGAERHLWYLRSHHIALDGFGYLLLIHRVAETYSAYRRGAEPPPCRNWSLLPLLAEEQRYRNGAAYAEDRVFWRKSLTDAPPPARLAPAMAVDDRPRSASTQLAPAIYPQWQAAARACGVDWAAWLIAAIAAWMHARGGFDEVSIGLLVMNRLGSAALSVPCMGMNVIPLRVHTPAQMSFRDLAQSVADELRTIRRHQRYNYEWMRIDAGLEGSHRQLYGPVLNLMPFDRGFVFDGLRSCAHPVSVGPVDDLDITVSPLADGMRFDIDANPLAYDDATLQAHHAALLDLIATVVHKQVSSLAALRGEVAAAAAVPVAAA